MSTENQCPACQLQLEIVAASGRADDLYLCPHCFHSWFAFELDENTGSDNADEPPSFH